MKTKTAIALTALLLAGGSAMSQTNIAPAGTASQSSTYGNAVAARAIDGNTDGTYWNSSIAHTGFDSLPWWQLALAGPAFIDSVKVWNRTDCCSDRLSDYTVSLWRQGSLVASQFFAGASPAMASFSFAQIQADTVRVQLSGDNYLGLAEVEVFGTPAAVPEPQSLLLMLCGLGLLAAVRRQRC